MFGRRSKGSVIASAVIGILVIGSAPDVTASADTTCRTVSLSWTPPGSGVILAVGRSLTYDTGMVVPAPEADETATVVASRWSSADRYPDGASPTREQNVQTHESWGITVGGVAFGGLTADLPDLVSDGADTPWYSGLVTGSFGTGAVGSGSVVLRHASLAGFTESPNSVHPQQLSLDIQYCRTTTTTTPTPVPAVVPTTTIATVPTTATTPTTEAPTPSTTAVPTTETASTTSTTPVAATAAPTTSTPPISEPTTTFVLPLLTAPTVPRSVTSTTITPAGPTVPTLPTTAPTPTPTPTITPGRLPETGSSVTGMLQIGVALVSVGAILAVVRRRLVV